MHGYVVQLWAVWGCRWAVGTVGRGLIFGNHRAKRGGAGSYCLIPQMGVWVTEPGLHSDTRSCIFRKKIVVHNFSSKCMIIKNKFQINY